MTKYKRAQIKMAGAVNRTMADQATLVATLPLLGRLQPLSAERGEVGPAARRRAPFTE